MWCCYNSSMVDYMTGDSRGWGRERRVLEYVVDWLGEACSSRSQGGNPPSPLPGPASVIMSIREFNPNTGHKTQN